MAKCNPKKTAGGIVVAAVAALLAGCGLVDIAYNNAPFFAASELEDVFELDDGQLERLDPLLEQFFAWHRTQELEQYRQLLDEAADAAEDGISADEFVQVAGGIYAAWQRSVEKAIDDFGGLAVSLTPQQIEAFDRYYRNRSQRFASYLDKSEQQREIYRIERDLERLQKWYGDFDYYQQKKTRARLLQLPDIYPSWIAFREQRHAAIVTALRQNGDAERIRAELKRVMFGPDTEHARAFDPIRKAYWHAYGEALEDISTWVRAGQNREVAARLRDYARIAERLNGQT